MIRISNILKINHIFHSFLQIVSDLEKRGKIYKIYKISISSEFSKTLKPNK